MKRIHDVKIGDILTLSMDLHDMTQRKQREIFGISASPLDPTNPEVLVIDDVGAERWIYLRTFIGFDDVAPTLKHVTTFH